MITLTKPFTDPVVVENADDIYDIFSAVNDMQDGESALRIEITGIGSVSFATAPCSTDKYARGCECPQCDSFGVANLIFWMT